MLTPFFVFSQKKLEILNANALKFDENLGNGAKRLIGDVKFKHNNAIMYCDSAYFYTTNSIDAFGNIHIQQDDSIHLYGNKLNYNGNDKNAIISENVIVKKGDMQLSTNVLHYNMSSNVGYYTTSAEIINSENKLSSRLGYFYANQNELKFKKNVVLTNRKENKDNPEFIINCDTMNYNTSSKIASFIGPTTIKSDENFIYCEDGWYDTENDFSRFSKNSYLVTGEQKMFGDSLYYNRNEGIGKVVKNISIIDTSQNLIINGHLATHFEKLKLSIVTDEALLKQFDDKDTLYLHADTLKSIETNYKMDELKDSSKESNRTIFAYHRVKFYKKDLQGKCDSLVYSVNDSMMLLLGQPILWSDENQLIGDTVILNTGKSNIKSIELKGNPFITSQEDDVHYNQIKGKYMKGIFRENELRRVDIEGNGQTIYYAKEDNSEKLEAVNKAECSNLIIYMKDNKVERINFVNKPEANLYPLDRIDISELKLKGFSWKDKYRPKKVADIFVWEN